MTDLASDIAVDHTQIINHNMLHGVHFYIYRGLKLSPLESPFLQLTYTIMPFLQIQIIPPL